MMRSLALRLASSQRVGKSVLTACFLLASWFGTPALANKVYWSVGGSGTIQRSNLDGSDQETVVSDGVSSARSLQIDIEHGKIYWADSQGAKIQRANLDGSNVEDLIVGLQRPSELALDPIDGKMYWIDTVANQLQSSDLDGFNVQTLIDDLDNVVDIALDLQRDQLYWIRVPNGESVIERSNLDGTGRESVAMIGLDTPAALDVDQTGERLYWAVLSDGSQGSVSRIVGADLAGENPQTIAENLVGGLAVDDFTGEVYWSAFPGGAIRKADGDGTDIESLFVVGGTLPFGLAVDLSVDGDVNGDRLVTLDDFDVMKQFLGQGTRRSQGDLTLDGQVDLNDFGMLKSLLSEGGAGQAVPEPGSLLLLIIGGLLAVVCRRRSR